jgi:predicted ATPase/DNA-binding NarL/FixJ family response regulator
VGGGSPPGSQRSQLPLELSSFVGRQDDLNALTALLGRTGLVTLIGPPGVGKSRLAVQVADVVRGRLAAQACLVDVSTCARADTLRRAVARAVEVGWGSQPASADRIAAALGDRNVALVLDNCDRMVADCAELATTLISRCPGLRLIASSRQRLGAPGEMVWKVAPLTVTDPRAPLAEMAANPSIGLFVDRAREVEPHFVLDTSNSAAVERICRTLDGLPLAIELAAAHVGALSVHQLAARLDDFVPLLAYGLPKGTYRHATLKAALESSVSRLSAAERRLLWRLSVFAGSWDLEAAIGVCTDKSVAAVDVPSSLAGLVARSLVQTVTDRSDIATRYRLLEVVRQYVRQRVETSGHAAAVCQRYALWYGRWVESIHVGDGAPEQIERMRHEQANLVAAMTWALASGDAEMGFSLATRLHGLWYIQGEFGESRVWFSRLLALPGGSSAARAVVANWASNHALAQGDFSAALKLSSEASAAAADLDDPALHAITLDGLGSILMDRGDLERAASTFEEERELCQRNEGLDWLLCGVCYRLAAIELEHGHLAEAQRLGEQALALLHDPNNMWMKLRAERVLGHVALRWRQTRISWKPRAMVDNSATENLVARFPIELTSFVGRQQEIENLSAQLEQVRLLTLTGPGGVGKTRLALRLVTARRTPDLERVVVVELGTIVDQRSLVATVAAALDIRLSRAATVYQLVDRLSGQHLVLVLDGCERLVPACAHLTTELLQHVSGLRIVATSRAPLGVAGERRWRLAPLALPGLGATTEEIASSEAVRMFVDRVHTQQPDFTLSEDNAPNVAALCRQLDGLPLALELASVRVPLLGLQSVANRAHQPDELPPGGWSVRPARHGSLAASVAWSWELLGGAGQLLLSRLAVFAGGWTLEAAESVCADERVPRSAVFAILERLVLQSVVEVDPGPLAVRYRLLETVRADALGRLAASGELDEMRDRHLRWCLQVAESVDSWSVDPMQIDRLEQELGNIQAALGSVRPLADNKSAQRLWVACWPLWLVREQREGRVWLARLSMAGGPDVDPELRARVAWLRGIFALQDGDYSLAIAELEASARLAYGRGEQLLRAAARYYVGEAYLASGQVPSATAALSEALRLAREHDHRLAPGVEARLALACLAGHDLTAARDHAQRALRDAEFSRHHWNLARAWESAGVVAVSDQDLNLAAAAFQNAVHSARLANDPQAWIAPGLSLAEIRLDQGEPGLAAGVLLEILDHTIRATMVLQRMWLPRMLQVVAEVVAAVRPQQAGRLVAAAEALRDDNGHGLVPTTVLTEARLAVEAVTRSTTAPTSLPRLSTREMEVAELLASGLSNRAIAEHLSLSEGTVRVHVGHILEKLGTHSRARVGQWLRRTRAVPYASDT